MSECTGTETDPAPREWAITDRVTQLRMWGQEAFYPLPVLLPEHPSEGFARGTYVDEARDELTLGSAVSCAVRLKDRLVSRRHAALVRRREGWAVRDLGSKNGILLDGASHAEGSLEPGTELTLGGVVLIAESEQLIELRRFLSRLLGWEAAQLPVVDRALRAVRMAASHRATLLLSGEGELALIAQALHQRVRGANRPFVLCDPRRRVSEGNVRSVANRPDAESALRAAAGGSLCFVRRRLPAGAFDVFTKARDPKARVQLIVCTYEQDRSEVEDMFSAASLVVPPLSDRGDEVNRIISEYADEAATEFLIPAARFTPEDRDWIRQFSAASLPDIEKGTRRLVAVRASQSFTAAAYRLGMAPVSLTRWLERRGQSGSTADDADGD